MGREPGPAREPQFAGRLLQSDTVLDDPHEARGANLRGEDDFSADEAGYVELLAIRGVHFEPLKQLRKGREPVQDRGEQARNLQCLGARVLAPAGLNRDFDRVLWALAGVENLRRLGRVHNDAFVLAGGDSGLLLGGNRHIRPRLREPRGSSARPFPRAWYTCARRRLGRP